MTIATVLTPQVLALLLAAAVLIFIIALVVMGFLLHGMKTALTGRVEMLATGQRASAELVDAGLERIKQELLHANATQGNNFANFLQIEQAGRDSQEQRLERLTQTLSGSLQQMNAAMASELACLRTANEQALGEMRATVDEKLQATLNTRITESFKTVEEQLAEVHRSLGEMREMARNVDGLRRGVAKRWKPAMTKSKFSKSAGRISILPSKPKISASMAWKTAISGCLERSSAIRSRCSEAFLRVKEYLSGLAKPWSEIATAFNPLFIAASTFSLTERLPSEK